MIIDKISTRRFGRHDAVDIDLPRTGVILITGKNGHGKSTLAEAVAQGGWNDTLRGAPGWRKGAKSGVELHFDGGHVRRSVSDSKHTLKWQVDEDGAGEYPTRTKSQNAFESHVGTFHVWKHACTFHTDDVARFTNTTDAARKRLLEEVLELDRIEKGYKRLRDTLNAARKEEIRMGHAHELAHVQTEALEDQLDLLSGELEEHADVHILREESRDLKQAVKDAKAHAEETQRVKSDAAFEVSAKQREIRTLEARVQRFAEWDQALCNACEQPMDEEHRADVVAGAKLEVLAARAEEKALSSGFAALYAAAESARAASDHAGLQYAQAVEAGRAAVAASTRNAEREERLDVIRCEVGRAITAETDKREALEAKQMEVAELEAAASVLSFQGVRAALLSAAVNALQDLANDWLARLGLDGLTVALSSQSTAKSGAVADKISFDVDGAGGGYGYKGCSTGERRRIDIAMMFALGELAESSRGVSPASTLWIDEVFDGLDEEGRDAVVVMLAAISQDRCVVVITHNKELTARLKPVLRLHATDGKLKVVS